MFVGVVKSASARVYDGKTKIDLCLCGLDSKVGQSVAFFDKEIHALDSLVEQLIVFDARHVFPMTAVRVGSATITTRLTIDPAAINPRVLDFVSQDTEVNVPDSGPLFVEQVLKPGALLTVHACPIFCLSFMLLVNVARALIGRPANHVINIDIRQMPFASLKRDFVGLFDCASCSTNNSSGAKVMYQLLLLHDRLRDTLTVRPSMMSSVQACHLKAAKILKSQLTRGKKIRRVISTLGSDSVLDNLRLPWCQIYNKSNKNLDEFIATLLQLTQSQQP
jgi:hypothetical protein